MRFALWLVWACCSVALRVPAAADAAIDGLTPETSNASNSLQGHGRHLKLLYVMEYDCIFDWEPVKLQTGVTDDVLAWMLNLQDRLTLTSQNPLGEELMVRSVVPCVLEL